MAILLQRKLNTNNPSFTNDTFKQKSSQKPSTPDHKLPIKAKRKPPRTEGLVPCYKLEEAPVIISDSDREGVGRREEEQRGRVRQEEW